MLQIPFGAPLVLEFEETPKTHNLYVSAVGTVAGSGYLGCYKDHRDRMLRKYNNNEKNNKKGVRRDFDHTNTPAECANFCKDYKYFGVESSQECYCGNALFHNEKKNEGECNYKCPGNNNQRCGGRWKINVYEVRSSSGKLMVWKFKHSILKVSFLFWLEYTVILYRENRSCI